MDSSERRKLTSLKNEKKFNICIEKLTTHKELDEEEKQFILECAILLIREYEKDKEHESYLEFAYFIILNYSLQYDDYEALYDFSINFGYYPIAKKIVEHGLIEINTIKDLLLEKKMNKFERKDIVETYEQYNSEKKILEDTNNYISYVAPTSYGKSSIINELIVNEGYNRIGIIVPTKSLINQTYRKIKKEIKDYKIIIHDEMYEGEERFIGILTQERALRLLEKEDFYFEKIYIDEAHNIFDDDSRSILLTRLIRKNKMKYANQKVVYFSPVINNSNSLKIKDSVDNIKQYKVKFNVKEPEIFELTLEGKEKKYNRFINEFYETDAGKPIYQYIIDNSNEKNFIFISRPVKIEKFSKELCSNANIPEIENDNDLEEIINMLKKHVHEDFYMIDLIKKGIVYIHGKMPEQIKDYLEYKFNQNKQLKYIIANHVILEGMNLPIDSLFILTVNSLSKEQLVNLIGRVNRLNEIFTKDKNNLKKLIPKIFFINSEEYNRNNSNMSNKIEELRSFSFDDCIKNPLMENYDINKLKISKKDKVKKQIKNQEIIKNEEITLIEPDNEREKIEKLIIECGISNYYANISDITNKILNCIEVEKNNKELLGNNIIDKIYNVFIKGQENNITNFEIKRLKNEEAIDYYKNYIKYNKKSLKERVQQQYEYFNKIKNDPQKREFYIGESYGEFAKETEDYPQQFKKVYIDLSSKDNKTLLNFAIAKIKIEDDFISFKINNFVTLMYKVGLIEENEYNEFVYGTKEKKKLNLIKKGLSISLVNKLNDEKQLDNLMLDKYNNIIANEELYEYINKLDDYEKFEIKKYL